MKKTKVVIDNEKLRVSVDITRALAHPLRLQILKFIDEKGATNVNKIYNTLRIEQSITSQHLKVLRLAGVVSAEKEGKFVHYKINYDLVARAEKAVKNFCQAIS